MTADSGSGGPRGAYGLSISGLAGSESLLVRAEPDWPSVEVSVVAGVVESPAESVDDEQATVSLVGGVAEVEREPGRVAFTFEEPVSLDALLHPYFAPIAGLFAHWHGHRESLHAGAFVAGGGAWGVLSSREGGKSSTLARLALEGVPVLTDDVLVLEGGTAFAGPRAIDLRSEPASALRVGDPLGVVGTRERWRLRLDDVEGSWPLRGWVFLTWGDDVAVTKVAAGDRLQRLAAERTIRLVPKDPTALLELVGLPSLELRRPQSWASLEAATALLRETIG
jgi:hypothetical protein